MFSFKNWIKFLIEPLFSLNGCNSEAAPCNEVEITTGKNGLPDLHGCELTIGVENMYVPFNYIDAADGVAKGWDYDVFNHMGELMNFTPVYVPMAWDGMIEAVFDGLVMVAGNGITATSEKDEIVDFSDGYIYLTKRILVSVNSDITSIDDIKNGDYKVAVPEPTNYDDYLFAIKKFGKNNITHIRGSRYNSIKAVIDGNADATIIHEIIYKDDTIGYIGPYKDQVKLVGDPLSNDRDHACFAFPISSPLVDVFDQGLAAMEESGKLAEINAKFFSSDFKEPDIATCDENIPEEYLPADCEV